MNQNKMILGYLMEHGTITAKEAYTKLGCMRLSARIKDLRDLGYDIDTEDVFVKTREGRKTRIARYKLNE